MSKDAKLTTSAGACNPGLSIPYTPSRIRRGIHGSSQWGLLVVIALSFTFQPGCRWQKLNVNEAMLVSYRDLVWAKRAYNLRYGNCDRPYGEHFYNGFCAGYEDVCNGGDGYVPALPPVGYRDHRFQSPDGAQCVNAWFEGYPAGVAAARQEKVGNYNNVLVSKLIDTAVTREKNIDRALPSDVPVKSGQPQPSAAPPLPTSQLPAGYSASWYVESWEEGAPVTLAADLTEIHSVVEGPVTPVTPPPIVSGSGIVGEAKSLPGSPSSSSGDTSRRLR